MWWPSKSDSIPPLLPNRVEHSSKRPDTVPYQYYLDAWDWDKLHKVLQNSPHATVLSAFILGSVSSLALRKIYVRCFKRIPNSEWITPDIIKRRRWLKGVVTRVGDGDGFRLYHTPGFGWNRPLKFRHIPKKLAGRTLSIRIAGADAPEGLYFGGSGQPYHAESCEYLKSLVLRKTVYCQVAGTDQYKRTVAMPYLARRILPGFSVKGKCVSLELVRAGYAVTYEKEGGYYGKYGKAGFLRIEADAKKARRGMWKDGVDIETPGQYKSRYAGRSASPKDIDLEPAEDVPAADPVLDERPNRFRRLFTRRKQK